MTDQEQYHLQWRGIKKGPWNLATIREGLKSDEIHSMYQIEAAGQWLPLRDFLESRPAGKREPDPTPAQRMNTPLRPPLGTSQIPRSSPPAHMDWKHVGIALCMLLGIVAGGLGSYAIVRAISTPAMEMTTVHDGR